MSSGDQDAPAGDGWNLDGQGALFDRSEFDPSPTSEPAPASTTPPKKTTRGRRPVTKRTAKKTTGRGRR